MKRLIQNLSSKAFVGATLATGMVAGPVTASADEHEVPVNSGNVSLTIGTDFTTEYIFRGIPQENQGLIMQPYADVTLSLVDSDAYTLDVYAGVWNSFHFDSSVGDNNDPWFESDIFVGAAVGLAEFGIDFGYTKLNGPNTGAEFAEEIHLGVSYDDSDLWGDDFGGVQPYVTVVWEIDGGSDVGSDKGTYFEVGVEPSFTLLDHETYPMTLSIPVTLGFGDDYYEDGLGNDESFGYWQIGLAVAMPLNMVPAEFGAVELTAGVFYLDGEAYEDDFFGVQGGDDDTIYGTLGISLSY